MVGNTGTYVDSARHRWTPTCADLGGVPLDRLADLPGVVVRVAGRARGRSTGAFAPYEVAGRAVLLHTGGDRYGPRPGYAADASVS